MLIPSEIQRLRDMRSADADAHIDLCRPRVLVLAKAPYGEYLQTVDALSYTFTDGQGASGLLPGDYIRGEIFGAYSSDVGAPTLTGWSLVINGSEVATLTMTLPDYGGDVVAYRLQFHLRWSGGERKTLNSPPGARSADARALMKLSIGDTQTSGVGVSQEVAPPEFITASGVLPQSVNIGPPLTLKVRWDADPGNGVLRVYGGALEGL